MAIITSSDGANVAGIDSNGAVSTRVLDQYGNPLTLGQAAKMPTNQAGLMLAGRNDNSARLLRADRMGNLRNGADQVLFYEGIHSSTLNVGSAWTLLTSTMTATQSVSAGIMINAGASAADAAYAALITQKKFTKTLMSPVHLRVRAQFQGYPNSVLEFGFTDATTTTAATGALVFRYTAAGSLFPVIIYNGTIITTGNDISSLVNNNGSMYLFDIIVDDDNVVFSVQDSSTGQIINEQTFQVPKGQVRSLFAAGASLPFAARVLNMAPGPATASKLIIGDVFIRQVDALTNKPWAVTKAELGHGGEWLASGASSPINFTNSTAPTAATLSNTAAGYTTLGGMFRFAAVAGAETDYALFGYTIPSYAGSFVCTGVHIHTYNAGAASATTPTLLEWFLVPNASAISLSTANLARVPVGLQSIPVGSAIGYATQDINVDFSTPLVTNPNMLFTVGLRMPTSTATASQFIRGAVTLKGFWE